MVSYVDIVPTFLDYAGVASATRPGRGRSILPVLDNPSLPGWDQVFGSHTFHELTNYYPTRFLRTPRYKYHRNICWKLDFPFSADIYASKSWEAIRNGPTVPIGHGRHDLMVGKRTLTQYVRRGPEELYDLLDDPHEVHNLAQDPAHAAVLKGMREAVKQWQRDSEDPWLFRDGVRVRSMTQYVGEDGWSIQDRFDFELENPGSG
jgi:N-sulfoglucosamine sulfohydrolase